MQHGSSQLTDWQARQGINQREGARKLGVHYTTFNQLLSGRRLPSRRMAIAIQTLTGIPVAAWTPTAVSKHIKRYAKQGRSTQYMQAGNA